MKAKSSFILLVLVLFLIAGCSENVTNVEEGEANGRVIGFIHGVITNANTNARLGGIQITWVDSGIVQETLSDSLGYYSITDLSPGDYEVSFSGGSNYATSRRTITIPTIQQIGITNMPTDDDFYFSETQDVDLYKKDATLIGVIYAEQDDENTNLADGVTVIADFNNYDISPDEFTTTTDTGGVFSFSNLPATPNVSLRTMPFNDGTNDYAVTSRSLSLIPGGTANAGNLILTIAPSTPFIVQNNFENNDFGLTENIVVTFSKAMDASMFDISLNSSYGNVEFESSWSNSITLTIDPYVLLQANTNYTLSLSGKSLDNNNFSTTYSFATQEGIQFVKTNLENVDGVFKDFPIDSNIELMFSMAVDLSNYNGYIRLYDESSTLVSTDQSLSTDSLTVIIDPLYDLEAGQAYTLNYIVYSYIEGDYDLDAFTFQSITDITIPTQVTGFAIDMGDSWKADWNTTSITFKWSRVTGVDGYRIYAKDNHNNSDFVRVGSFSAQDYVTEQSGTVYLTSYPQFDYYNDDGIRTPFTNGTEITFKIAAYNDAGEGTFSSALIVKDETAPTISLSQDGGADNTIGENTEFVINLSQIEYCSSSNPTFTILESGGDPNYVLPSSAIVWEWDSNLRDGQATVTVPSDKCGAGDMLIVTVMDNSGNTSDPDTLYLTPIISFESPTADTTWEAPSALIDWTIDNSGVYPGITYVDVWLSIDGGFTWIDTLVEYRSSSYYSWNIPDTLLSDGQAVIGLTNSNGGYTWKSDLFTLSGIRVTAPTAIQQDSTTIEIAWDYAGIDSVLIEYRRSGWNWTVVDTISNTGAYDWMPQLGLNTQWDFKIRVSDFDADYRPRDESDWFTINPK